MTLQEEFVKELKALEESGAGMPFVFTPSEAFTLLALLQLALRHPYLDDVGATTADFARNLAENIEQRLCITPAMQEVARRGWQPEHDV
jgi:hypothetical protein